MTLWSNGRLTALHAVVVFSGEHDLHSAPEVKELLDSLLRQDDLVVADFSSAQFVDSSILRVLLDILAQALELGKVFLQLHTTDIVGPAFEKPVCSLPWST